MQSRPAVLLAFVSCLLSPLLPGREAQALSTTPEFAPDEVLVKFKAGVPKTLMEATIAACATEIKLGSSAILDAAAASPAATGAFPTTLADAARNLYWLRITAFVPDVPATLSCFAARSDIVEFAEANLLDLPAAHQADNYPNDPAFRGGRQWSLLNAGQPDPLPLAPDGNVGARRGSIDADVDATQAWDLRHRDCRGVVVAVFDTGVDLAHPDLVNNLWVNAGETPGNGIDDDGNGFIDDAHGFDMTQAAIQTLVPLRIRDLGNDGPADTLPAIPAGSGGHGTHVAGIIGAQGNNGRDIAGICWQARLMILRIGDPITSNARLFFATLYTLVERFHFGHNVRVINLSYGMNRGRRTSPVLSLMFNLTAGADILFNKAAANNDMDLNEDADADGLADFVVYPCNSAERTPNVICVAASDNRDAVATGVNSNAHSNFGAVSVDLAAPGENIDSLALAGGRMVISGTSMATPHVSGVAALAFALFPAKTALQVKQDILIGAVGPPAASGPDVINTVAANSVFGNVASNGRLRWPYSADLGDAPLPYETQAAPLGGALHWDVGNEYFGLDVTPEVDANTPPPLDQDPAANIVPLLNRDLADYPLRPGDGRFAFKPPPPWVAGQLVAVDYQVCSDALGINDADGGRYQGGDSDRTLYVNAWFDMNRNGTFELDELLLEDIISPPPASPILPKPNANVTVNQHAVLPLPAAAPVFPPRRRCVPIASQFFVPPPGGVPLWIRFRLDYGEDMGSNDPDPVFRPDGVFPMTQHLHWARHGEMEDFRLCDIQTDGRVDRLDLNAILAARNQSAGNGDARDIDNDHLITVNDARICALHCDNSLCTP